MKRSQLSKKELAMLEVVETQIDHCRTQTARFEKEKDRDSKMEWFYKQLQSEKILKEIKLAINLDED